MKSIIFNTEMVRAILDGRKTQTRRIIKLAVVPKENSKIPIYYDEDTDRWYFQLYDKPYVTDITIGKCPFGKVGDKLVVRTIFGAKCDYFVKDSGKCKEKVSYRYNDYCERNDCPLSDISLENTDIRVERVQDISTGDVVAEGYQGDSPMGAGRSWFTNLWNSIYDKDAWERNDRIWVLTFKMLDN